MKFIKRLIRNIAILISIFLFIGIFAKIFYPETIGVFRSMAEMITGMKLWPIVILLLILSAVPSKE